MSTIAVILAAGFGKRMYSATPKVLHQINGDPSLLWVIRALPPEIKAAVVVVNYGKDLIKQALAVWSKNNMLPCPITTVDQTEPLGTGHAVKQAAQEIDRLKASQVIILCGDVPLVRSETIRKLTLSQGAVLAMDVIEPTGYGRIIQHSNGSLKAIVEQIDASPDELDKKRVNGGAYSIPWQLLKNALNRLSNNNAKGEYYLTDAVVDVAKYTHITVELCDKTELIGMNSRKDQAHIQSCARERINNYWMEQGVTFLNQTSTIIGPRVTIGRDVTVGANTCLTGRTQIGSETLIDQGCVISDCHIGSEVNIKPYCVITHADVGDHCILGPFANLRQGSLLEHGVHVGNFVEIKNSTLHSNVKANHLSYIGDAEVGEHSNLGAGFITCNYDGFNKHRTVIGKKVFIGSDCQLIAPITLGDQCILGAGSTITSDIPEDSLALTRAPLVITKGVANYIRQKQKARKSS